MTTQNTHHEQYDVDANVVEYSSAPEPTATPDSSDANLPAESEAQASTDTLEIVQSEEQVTSPTPEPAASDQVEEEQQDTVPAVQEEEQNITVEPDRGETQNIEESVSADQSSQIQSAEEAVEEAPSYIYPTTIPLTEIEAEVRPFTDFIEEFRQAEARLQASVQESETEVFQAIAPVDATPSEQEVLPEASSSEELSPPEPIIIPIDEIGIETVVASPQEESPTLTVPATSPESVMSEEKNSVLVAQVSEIEASNPTNEISIVPAEEEQTAHAAQEAATAIKPVERAVSPLLRPPSSRLRLPRHGTTRHPQREAVTEVQPEAEWRTANKPAEPVTLAAPTDAVTPTNQVEVEIPAVEEKPAPVEAEKPRPARRYRFDRPAVSNSSKPAAPPAVPVRSEEPRPAALTPAIPGESVPEPSDANTAINPKPAANGLLQTDLQSAKSSAATETPITESANGTTSTNQEHGRRRQSHERNNKEQAPTIVPVPEASEPATETATKAKEVVPEDLPPLEYADIQKVNSRRRRRHRSSSSNGVPTPTIQNTPDPQPTTTTSAPATATHPADSTTAMPTPSAQYTIVSGYTVNQMNLGNEASGPFMAPEPSPARGSIITRDSRISSRPEVQRGPAPTYPHVRPASEAGLTSAALNHFGNTIAQAIQTQTDRMVAELHRVTQTPANISVTLPPFPSNERVGVFVDVANLLYSARTLNLAVDFGKLLDFLRGNRRLIRAQAYCPTSPQPGAEQMFLQAVKGLGYRITTKNYKTFSSGAKKADLDLDLCMDVVRLVDGRAVDCIVLVSGDSDFMPMLDYCSDHGVRVEVAAFDEAMSATLRQSCDLFINLSMLDDVLARA